MESQFTISFDGNPDLLRPEFWRGKKMVTHQDSYTVFGITFYQYGKEISITAPKPYLVDADDGSTDLNIDFVPTNERIFRARIWQYLPFLFIVLPLRWLFRLLISLWTDIFTH